MMNNLNIRKNNEYESQVRQFLKDLPITLPCIRSVVFIDANHIQVEVIPSDILQFYNTVKPRFLFILLTMVALDRRREYANWQVRTIWCISETPIFLEVVTNIDQSNTVPELPSITPLFPAANWYEREMYDFFGIVPVGHPDPRRLAMHYHWPNTNFPLRQDENRSTFPPYISNDEYFQNRTTGSGVMEIPVGPIHAGIIEPAHFRFSAVGETIVNLEATFFYTHKGIEKQLEGLSIEQARYIIERTCAACTVANTLAYCQALEQIAGTSLSSRATFLRVIFAELERLYNHIGDTGNLCAGVGFHVGIQEGAALKEILLDLQERLTGSRYLFGVLRLGGVGVDLSPSDLSLLHKTLAEVRKRYQRLIKTMLLNTSVVDRFTGAGIIFQRTARELGAVGVAARACGVDRDVRRDIPYAAYTQFNPIAIPLRISGDVLARLEIRIEEVAESFRLIDAAIQHLPDGAIQVPLGSLPAASSGFSLTESARGAVCHWFLIGPNQTIKRARLRTASYVNWPLVPRAALNNIVPDFPLINKSFELCYSCLDR